MTATKNYNLTWLGAAITFIGAVMFSTKAIIVKKAFHDISIDALSLLMVRMIFSLPFFIGTVVLEKTRKDNQLLSKKQWISVIALGLFGYYISSLLDFIGLQYVSAGLERLILFLYPSFAVLINTFIFKQPITRIQVLALLLTYTGIGIAYAGQIHVDNAGHDFYFGSLLIFLCAVSYAIYIAGSGRVIPHIGASKFTAYAMLASTAGLFIHYLFAGNSILLQAAMRHWGYGLVLAIVATVIPSFLISFGMKKIGSNNVAIISGVGPVSTIVQAHFILGEPVFVSQLLGTMQVIAGVLLIGWKTGHQAVKKTT